MNSRTGKAQGKARVRDSSETAAPAGYVSIEDMVAKVSKDPARAAALASARKRLAPEIDEGAVTVRSLRLDRGMSQVELARMLGTSQSHVARIEAGTENLALATLRKLADALSVDMNGLNDALLVQERLNAGRRRIV